MKSVVVEIAAPGRVRLVEEDIGAPGDGEVVVRTLYSGISSGTESLVYGGGLPSGLLLDETLPALARELAYPVRYGYSCVGEIEGGATVFAFHPHQSRFVASMDSLLPLSGVSPRVATLFPLVETALQVALDAGDVRHEHVVVVGLGVVGTLTAALLGRDGAIVLAAEPREWRRRVAAAFGVDALAPEDLAGAVRRRTGGEGAALVVEASGNPAALAGALDLLAHEGTILVASWYGSRSASIPLGGSFHRRRLTIRSSQVSTIPAALSGRWTVERRRAAAADLMRTLPLAALATHEWPVGDAAQAFAAVASGLEGLMHAALRYD